MPLIDVSLLSGRDAAQKRKLIEALTQATVDALGSDPKAVTVILRDVERTDWASAGVPLADKKPG